MVSRERKREIARAWYQAHKDRYAKWSADYAARNADKLRAYKAEWARQHRSENAAKVEARRAADPDGYRARNLAYQAKYRETHRADIRAKAAEYRATHREERRQSSLRRYHSDLERSRALVRIHNHNRRARIAGRKSERIDRRLLYDREMGICGICHRRVSRKAFTIDHIVPIAKGGDHAWSNVQIAHFSCNRRKSASLKAAQLVLPIHPAE